MEAVSVKNFDSYLHYKTGRPNPWIKLPVRILHSEKWNKLSDSHKGQFISILLLAAESDNDLPADASIIQATARLSGDLDLRVFLRAGLIEYHGELEGEALVDALTSGKVLPTEYKEARVPVALPKSFSLTKEMRDWADETTPTLDARLEFARFIAKAQAKGWKYKNWVQAWRNWMLNEVRYDAKRMAVKLGKIPGEERGESVLDNNKWNPGIRGKIL